MFFHTKFIDSLDSINDADIVLAGFPYDGTSSYRSGSRFAAREIRSYSYEAIEDFSFHLHKGLDSVKFFDAGDMELMVGDPQTAIENMQTAANSIIRTGKKLLAIGGEHLITLPLFLATQKIHGDFTLLQLDAHADLRPEYADNQLSHASVMNLCLQNNLTKLIQIGVRSGTKEEYQMRQNDQRIIPLTNINGLAKIINKNEKIYLSLDVDFFDPAQFPATGTPEAGGASFDDFIKILQILLDKQVNLIGADINEFIPDLDHTKISTSMAAKLVREILLTLAV